ncbi:ribokinase [Saccharopolyspora mangrovi]|uniref:Ribokinase n=1 Tax=Saccharopolyspora mangrovi TaxID=3082379 RepID=A0ABU6ACI1_9PSEU|nr:ribokinase [Saccharopolyspora sp. S2-29]MEB3369193.1 ribokinase [Saccharopolyspora sp. S2-29]
MSRELDVVVVGSLNVDLTAGVHRHPRQGETVRATALTTGPGGKGANQAVAAARLGARTALIGRVGADAHGQDLLAALGADGVETARTLRDESAATGTALINVAETGENSIVVAAGANAHVSPDDLAAARPLIDSARVVSVVLEVPVDAVCAAARAARDAGARLALNLSPVVDLPAEVLAAADPLIVNEHEAREVLQRNGVQLPGEEVGYAEALRQVGARSVVVTLGPRGAAVTEPGHAEHVPGAPADAVDTTGAGDAFAATVAWRVGQGDALAEAARWATRVAARSVQQPGAQPSYPKLADVVS